MVYLAYSLDVVLYVEDPLASFLQEDVKSYPNAGLRCVEGKKGQLFPKAENRAGDITTRDRRSKNIGFGGLEQFVHLKKQSLLVNQIIFNFPC